CRGERVRSAGSIYQSSLAENNMVAGVERRLADLPIVDIGAVRAADVDKKRAAIFLVKLGVAARDFGVMQANLAGGIAADRDLGFRQLKLLAFVGAFYDQQARHDRTSLRECFARIECNLSRLARKCQEEPALFTFPLFTFRARCMPTE